MLQKIIFCWLNFKIEFGPWKIIFSGLNLISFFSFFPGFRNSLKLKLSSLSLFLWRVVKAGNWRNSIIFYSSNATTSTSYASHQDHHPTPPPPPRHSISVVIACTSSFNTFAIFSMNRELMCGFVVVFPTQIHFKAVKHIILSMSAC